MKKIAFGAKFDNPVVLNKPDIFLNQLTNPKEDLSVVKQGIFYLFFSGLQNFLI